MSFSAFEQPRSTRSGQVAHKDRQASIVFPRLQACLMVIYSLVKKIATRHYALRIAAWGIIYKRNDIWNFTVLNTYRIAEIA